MTDRIVSRIRFGGVAVLNAAKTHCPRGHAYTAENLVREPKRPNHRACLICQKAREQRRGILRRASRPPLPSYGEIIRLSLERNTIPEPNSGCLLWIGSVNEAGYGKLSAKRFGMRNLYAHRVSYELHNGPLKEGLEILHSCDVPACVNPRHLTLDTRLQNAADCKTRGRNSRAEGHGRAKLTNDQALAIFAMSGEAKVIARAYGVVEATVKNIWSGKNWSSITGKSPT